MSKTYHNWYFDIRQNSCARNCVLLYSEMYLPTLCIIDNINHKQLFNPTDSKLNFIERSASSIIFCTYLPFSLSGNLD